MLPVQPPAEVVVNEKRCYIDVNDAACELLGYTREEMLRMKIDDISYPSAAHVRPMYAQYLADGSMKGIFALRRKSGDIIWVRYKAKVKDGKSHAVWTHYEPWDPEHARPDNS